MAEKVNKKKKNIFVEYFKPFGLRQTCDLLMLLGAIVIFVGLFLHGYGVTNIALIVGMSIYAVACCIAIYRSIRVMTVKDVNKRSPEYKNAMINIIIMSIILVIAVLGIFAVIFNVGAQTV